MKYIDDETRHELMLASPQFPARVLAHQGFDKARLHWHDGFEIIYARRGRASLTLNHRRHLVGQGEVKLIPPRCLHEVELLGDPTRPDMTPQALSITLAPEELIAIMPFVNRMQDALDYAAIERESGGVIADYCDRIYLAITSGGPERYLTANALFFSLLARIFDSSTGAGRALGGAPGAPAGDAEAVRELSDARVIHKIWKYARTHYQEHLTVVMVAEQFGYSREHFSRMFKRYSNTTFKDYLTQVRLHVACDLLVNTETSVSNIRKRSGFANAQSFRNAFMEEFHCGPAEYRRHAWQGEA